MRPTTLSKEWRDLIEKLEEEAGPGDPRGVELLCKTLDVSSSTFFRASHGQATLSVEKRLELEILCDLYGIKNPLPKPWSKDLRPLRRLGDVLEKGLPVAPRTLKELRSVYPEAQLVALANSDGTPDTIMRAVQALLEE